MKRAGVSTLRRSTRDLAGWIRCPSVSNDDATISPSNTKRPERERRGDLGEVARQRLAVARLQLDVVAVDERDAAKAVVLGLVGPALAVRQCLARACQLGQHGRFQRQRHCAAP